MLGVCAYCLAEKLELVLRQLENASNADGEPQTTLAENMEEAA